MSLPKPKCPKCGGDRSFITRHVDMRVEDTDRPRYPIHAGAGTTHPAYDLVHLRGDMIICRSCGTMYFDTDQFVGKN